MVLIYGCSIAIVDNKKDAGVQLIYKKLAAKQFIKENEGWLGKAKHDGVDKKGQAIYTIGFGTRAKAGQTIDVNKADAKFNKYLNDNVWPELDPSLPINKYVAYASFIFSTSFGHQPKSCDDIMIREYQMPGTKYERGLVKRRTTEYNLCKGEINATDTNQTIQRK